MDQEKIGNFIVKTRKAKKLTQVELAEKLGVTDRAVSNWENGKNMPDYSVLDILCNSLDISINELYYAKNIVNNDYKDISEDNLKLYIKEKYSKKLLIKRVINGLITGILVYIIVYLIINI